MINLPLPPPPSVHHLHVRAKRPRPRLRERRSAFLPMALFTVIVASGCGAVSAGAWYIMKPTPSSDVHETLRVATDETLRLWRKNIVPAWDEARFRPNEPVSWTIDKIAIKDGAGWVPVDIESRGKSGTPYHGRYFLRWEFVRGGWRLADVLNKEAAALIEPDREWILKD